MPGPAGDSIGGRSAAGRSDVSHEDGGNNQNHFLYSGCAINPTCAVPERKSIIAEELVSRLAQLCKNIVTHFLLESIQNLISGR